MQIFLNEDHAFCIKLKCHKCLQLLEVSYKIAFHAIYSKIIENNVSACFIDDISKYTNVIRFSYKMLSPLLHRHIFY